MIVITRGQLRFSTGSARTKGAVMGRAIDNGAQTHQVFSTQTRQGRLGRVVWHAASAAMLGSRRVQFLATRSWSEPRRADLGSQPEVDCGRRLCSVCRSRRFLNPTAELRQWLRPFGPPEIRCRGMDIFDGFGIRNLQ